MTYNESKLPIIEGLAAEKARKQADSSTAKRTVKCTERIQKLCQTVKQMTATIQANHRTQLML
jgi:hypothetical protein